MWFSAVKFFYLILCVLVEILKIVALLMWNIVDWKYLFIAILFYQFYMIKYLLKSLLYPVTLLSGNFNNHRFRKPNKKVVSVLLYKNK